MKATLTLATFGLALSALAQQGTPAPTLQAAPTATTSTIAQAPSSATGVIKLGYTNVQYLLAASPQTKVIKSQLETASKQYEKAIQDKIKELEEKFAAYQKNEATMMESIKQDKQSELRNLEQSIRTLQENAQGELKNKESELVKPELDKIYAAINDVAKDNGFTFIFNSDQVLLYAAEGADATPLVLKKLGYPELKDEEPAKPAANATGASAPKANTPAPSGKPGSAPSPSGKKGKK